MFDSIQLGTIGYRISKRALFSEEDRCDGFVKKDRGHELGQADGGIVSLRDEGVKRG